MLDAALCTPQPECGQIGFSQQEESMTMTIQDLGALGEFFGSIAVLATLVYLALQT